MYSRKRKIAIALLAAITLIIYVPKVAFAAEEQTPVLVQIYDTEVGTEAFERLVQYGNGGHSTLGQALADAGVTDVAPGIGLGIGSGGNGYRPSVTLAIWTNETFDPEAARQAIKNLINTPSDPVTTNGDCAIACDGTYESDSSTTTTVVDSTTVPESTTTTTPSAQPVVESDSSSQPTTEPVVESNDQSSTPEQPAPQPAQPESSNEPSVLPDTQTTSTTTTVPSLVFSNGYAYEVQPLISNQIITNPKIVSGKNNKVISTKKTITKKRIVINKKPVTTRK